ncbi:MAG TPA: hypothetical protein VGH99_01085 [Pseudonocardia sp.]
MAQSEKKAKANEALESAVTRVRELNERIVDSARRGGEESVRAYERMLENVAEAQEAAGNRGGEWVQAFGRAQASFTRQLAEAFPSVLSRLGVRARDAAETVQERGRQVPAVAEAEGQAKGSVAREQDLPIAGYDGLRADEVIAKLGGLSQTDLAKVDAYERRNDNRKTIHDKITALRD